MRKEPNIAFMKEHNSLNHTNQESRALWVLVSFFEGLASLRLAKGARDRVFVRESARILAATCYIPSRS